MKQLQISNCLSLHRFALEHQLQELTQTIWNYILVCLSSAFCVGINLFVFKDHFSDIIQNNHEFLEVSFEEIRQLLASGKMIISMMIFVRIILDDINVQSEEIVYEAFISWLDFDLNRQNNYLVELFSLIRLPLIKRKV